MGDASRSRPSSSSLSSKALFSHRGDDSDFSYWTSDGGERVCCFQQIIKDDDEKVTPQNCT
jgi:hypothetical protein